MQEPVTQESLTPEVASVQKTPIETKKKGLILKIVIILFLVFLLCTSCGVGFYFSEKKLEEYLTTWVNEDFETYLKPTSQIPEGFPINEVLFTDDYRVYKAGTNTSGLWKYSVVYVTSKDENYVKDIYTNKMLEKGWKLDSTSIQKGVDTISLVKDNKLLTVALKAASKDGINITAVDLVYMEY